MKSISLLALLISFITSYSQSYEPSLKEGMYQPYVIQMKGFSANQIYDAALDWIKNNDAASEKTLKSTVKNKSIRFEGITGIRKNKVNYVILLEFKNGEYSVTPETLEFFPYKEPFERKWFYNKDGTRRANSNSEVLDNALLAFNSMDLGILEVVEKTQLVKTEKSNPKMLNLMGDFGTHP